MSEVARLPRAPRNRPRASPRRSGRELRRRAASRTRTPALLLSLFSLIQLCFHAALTVFVISEWLNPVGLNADSKTRLLIFGVVCAMLLTKDVVVLLGMRALERRRNYSLAYAGTLCALIPDLGWVVSAALAIWALVVLHDRDVKAAFEAIPTQDQDANPPDPSAPVRAWADSPSAQWNDEDQFADARAAVRVPAILLLVAWSCAGLVTLGLVAATTLSVVQGNAASPGAQAERPAMVAISLGAIVATALGLAGAWSALHLRRRGLAILSAVLLGVCFMGCLLGLGLGIWATIVFLRPDVTRAFAARADQRD